MVKAKSNSSRSSSVIIKKFPVKCAQELLDDSINRNLSCTLKNPKAIEKWLLKLRKNIVSKFAVCSKLSFKKKVTETTPNLEKYILELSMKIRQQMEMVKKVEDSLMTKSNLEIADTANVPTVSSHLRRISQIVTKIENVAVQLSSVKKDISNRSEAFESTVKTIEASWSSQIKFASNAEQSQQSKEVIQVNKPLHMLLNLLQSP